MVFEQLANVKMRTGELGEAIALSDRAVALANEAPMKRNLGDALDTRARLAVQLKDRESGIAGYKLAFAAYKAVGRDVDCARTMNNLAQCYFDAGRYKGARRALSAADRLAANAGADAVRARSRVLLGEIEALDGNPKKASALWHDAMEIARRTRDTVVHFKAEFQVFKLSIAQGNSTATNALGRRLNRMAPWISRSEPEVIEFVRLFALHKKPKQRGVARSQRDHTAGGNAV